MYRFFLKSITRLSCKYAGKGAMNVPDLKCVGADIINAHMHACMRITIVSHKNPFELLVFVIKSREETSWFLLKELFYYSTTIDLHIIMDMHRTQ